MSRVLVLLVIFMVTAPLVAGLVDLPTLESRRRFSCARVIIRADTSLVLRERTGAAAGQVRERNVSTAGWLPHCGKQARNPDQPVVIAGDKNVRYDAVLKVMGRTAEGKHPRVGSAVKAASPDVGRRFERNREYTCCGAFGAGSRRIVCVPVSVFGGSPGIRTRWW